jgi:glycosyltransferase involved in cell wall biosynthesis
VKPLASILLPVFETERYIGQAIESVLKQTVTDWELVISDNASSDRTWEIVQSFKDARIRTFRQTSNIGMVANWNFVFHEGRAPIACVLGADDLFEPNHLERKLKLLSSHPESLFVHGPVKFIDAEGKLIRNFETVHGPETRTKEFLQTALYENYVNPSVTLFRLDRAKEFGVSFDPRYTLVMDWHFWIVLALRSEMILADTESTAQYRVHDRSLSSQTSTEFQWAYERYLLRSDVFTEYRKRWLEFGFDVDRLHRDITREAWPLAIHALRKGRLRQFQNAWSLYRRVWSPADALLQAPSYLAGRMMTALKKSPINGQAATK